MSRFSEFFNEFQNNKNGLVSSYGPKQIKEATRDITAESLRDALKTLSDAAKEKDRGVNVIAGNEMTRLAGHLSLCIRQKFEEACALPAPALAELDSNIFQGLRLIFRDKNKPYYARYRCADPLHKESSPNSVREREMLAMVFVRPNEKERKELFKFYADHPETLLKLRNWFLQHYAFGSAREIRRAARVGEKKNGLLRWMDLLHCALPRVQAATFIGLLPLLTTNEAWSVLWSISPWMLAFGGVVGLLGFLGLVYYETAKQLDDFPAQKRPIGRRMWGIGWRAGLGALAMTGLTWALRWGSWTFAPNTSGLAGIIAFTASAIFALFVGYVLTLFLEDKSLADPF